MKDNWLRPIKNLARRIGPGQYDRLQAAFSRRRYDPLYKALVASHGCNIAAGPFTGMVYLEDAYGSSILPKLAGSYEMELFPVIERIIKSKPAVIIDVGCAEGYYAVGLARALPDAFVMAYDIEAEARQMCAELATRNGVAERVTIRGHCGAQELNALPQPPTLVFCDCEGYELDLLDPEKIPTLQNSDLLVELHDAFRPGLSDVLLRRFASTHKIELVNSTNWDCDQIPSLQCIPARSRKYAVEEGRPGIMQWAYMIANNRNAAGTFGVGETGKAGG